MIRCFECDEPTINPEIAYGENVCDDCEQTANEIAWERHCDSFHGGGGPLPLRQQQIEAMRFKR